MTQAVKETGVPSRHGSGQLLFWAVSSGKRDITSFHLIHGEEEADGMKGGSMIVGWILALIYFDAVNC